MNPKCNFYFEKNAAWKDEIKRLRKIALSSKLTEELKWGCPCYTLDGNNIFLIHVFKEYCALLFFKGAIMKDPEKLLIQQTKNVQAARQMRFTHADEISERESDIKKYMKEAIRVEKSGAKVELKKTNEFEICEEFSDAINKNKELKKSFEKLTPGRQRGYLLYFSSAKQSKTRVERIEKYRKHILKGKGLDD